MHSHAVRHSLVSLLLILTAPLITCQTALQRDAQALTIIAKMQAAAGWPIDGSLKDITVTATMTITGLDGKSHSDQLIIKAREADERVLVTNLTTGASMLRIGEFAVYKNGKDTRTIPWLAMAPFYGSFIPFLTPFQHIASSDRTVLYQGEANIEGVATYVISTKQDDTATGVRADLRRRAAAMTVYVSQSTLLPVGSEVELSLSNYTAKIPTDVRYQKYQQVGGHFVPFEIDIQPKHQASFQIVIQNVQWNVGLTTADFTPE